MSARSKGTLRTRVALLLGMASAFSLIVVLGVLFTLSRNIGGVVASLEQEEQIERIGNEISMSILQNVSHALASMTSRNGQLYSGFAADCQEIRETIDTYQLLELSVEERETVATIKVMHQDLEALMLYISTAQTTNPDLDLTEDKDRIIELASLLDQQVGGMSRRGSERLRAQLEGLSRWEVRATRWIMAGGLISAMVFFLIGLIYTRRILAPLDELREATSRVREGEFTFTVPEGKVDEISQLSTSFSEMTDALRESEKRALTNRLESIGLLAGGIAHDFNNYLMAIYGSLAMIRRELPADAQARELLEEAEVASLRAKNLTQQLLTFARGGKPVKKPVAIGRMVRQAVAFALRGSPVTCLFEIADDLWPAELDEGQMGQVLSNLVINAEQSMPGGGMIRVSAENLEVDHHTDLPLTPGPHLRVSIRDEGTGILPEHRQKIFDPYFTTKQRGSGLGLAVAQSVVTRHGGIITVASDPGKGSRFHVHLPADPKLRPPGAPGNRPTTRDRTGRVLVMDDEAGVLKITGMLLADLGFQPEQARNGEQALELFRRALEEGQPFRLVICDLVVPGGMGGAELVQALRQLAPHTPVIAASGYTNDPVLAAPAAFGFDDALAKPFSVDELERALNRLPLE